MNLQNQNKINPFALYEAKNKFQVLGGELT